MTAFAVAVKLALLAPDGTVMLPGTVTPVPAESVTGNPPLGAAVLSPTVQDDVPGALTVAGVQLRLVKVAGPEPGVMVMVPPLPDEGIGVAAALEATTFVTVTGKVGPVVPAAMLKVTKARGPFPITVAFMPYTTQEAPPAAGIQTRLFPAFWVAEPGTAAMLGMAEEEYPMNH